MSIVWRQFAKRQQAIEKAFVTKMEAAIRAEINKAINLWRHGATQSHIAQAFNTSRIHSELVLLYHIAAIQEANIHYKKLKTNRVKLVGLGNNATWNKIIDTYLLQHNIFNTVEQINDTTKKRVLQLISEGLQRGDSVDVIIRTIEDDDIPLKRAKLIVRTESVGAMNMGSMIGAVSTGIMYQKKWITAGDHRVRGTKPTDRFDHVILNGELIDMDKPFNNGQPIMFPGDKRAAAGNFCNCRCCLGYIAKRDDNGRIMRYPELSTSFPPNAGNKITDILLQVIAATLFGAQMADLFEDLINNN